MGLWREIVELGYPGEYKSVSRLVGYLRKIARDGTEVPALVEGMTPRKTVGLLLRRPEERSAGQRSAIKALICLDPEIEQMVNLFEWFARLVRRQPNENLEEWLRYAEGSGIGEIERFVNKLRQDLDAVAAGMSLPWSQGQTEGQVTRLKLIRRQMYGRGNFDLLRKRVLRAA